MDETACGVCAPVDARVVAMVVFGCATDETVGAGGRSDGCTTVSSAVVAGGGGDEGCGAETDIVMLVAVAALLCDAATANAATIPTTSKPAAALPTM